MNHDVLDEVAHRLAADLTLRSTHPPPQLVPATAELLCHPLTTAGWWHLRLGGGLGQNFIRDRAVINAIVDIVSRTDGPIIEIGAGDGAVTLPLQTLGGWCFCVAVTR